jgi:hypothetical protein
MGTRHFRRTKNQRIDSKVPIMSMRVCFNVFNDVDTLFGSNDGSKMVDCLIRHEPRSCHLPPHSEFTFSQGVPCVYSSTGVKV